MEKRTPHHALPKVQALIREGRYSVTATAIATARRDFGLVGEFRLADRVLALDRRDFHKSMTCSGDPKQWQDVYRPTVEGIAAYIKVQITEDETVIISFKALEDD